MKFVGLLREITSSVEKTPAPREAPAMAPEPGAMAHVPEEFPVLGICHVAVHIPYENAVVAFIRDADADLDDDDILAGQGGATANTPPHASNPRHQDNAPNRSRTPLLIVHLPRRYSHVGCSLNHVSPSVGASS